MYYAICIALSSAIIQRHAADQRGVFLLWFRWYAILFWLQADSGSARNPLPAVLCSDEYHHQYRLLPGT